MNRKLRQSIMLKLLLAASSCILAMLIFVYATNALVAKPGLRKNGELSVTPNDLYLRWLLGNDPVFVARDSRGRRATDPELQWLDNGCDVFTAEKSPGTYRIFCVGGSTTRGWPFHKVVSYPRLLDLYLRDALPGRKIEVINAGFMAFDSTRDIAVVRELLAYQPDLILIYEGRNELHNLPLHTSYFSWAMTAHAWLLRHVHLYGWLSRLAGPKTFSHADGIREFLARSSPRKATAIRNEFMRNLEAMTGECSGKGCAVALVTQVVSAREKVSPVSIHAYNQWLREFARSRGIVLIDADAAFRRSAVGENELIIPGAVHPGLKGYALLARTVCRALAEEDLILPRNEWRWRDLKDDDRYFEELGVTAPFLHEVYVKLSGIFAEWPGLGAAEEYYRRMAEKCVTAPGREPGRSELLQDRA